MSLLIGSAIYNLLKSAVGEETSNNIYPLIADDNVTFPFVVYFRDNVEPTITKGGYSNTDIVTMNVVICSDNYKESLELANKVRLSLDGIRGTYTGVDIENSQFIGCTEDYSDKTFIQLLNFKFETNK